MSEYKDVSNIISLDCFREKREAAARISADLKAPTMLEDETREKSRARADQLLRDMELIRNLLSGPKRP